MNQFLRVSFMLGLCALLYSPSEARRGFRVRTRSVSRPAPSGGVDRSFSPSRRTVIRRTNRDNAATAAAGGVAIASAAPAAEAAPASTTPAGAAFDAAVSASNPTPPFNTGSSASSTETVGTMVSDQVAGSNDSGNGEESRAATLSSRSAGRDTRSSRNSAFERSEETLPATGGAPLFMSLAGLLLAAGSLLGLRKLQLK